jgi:hypothetical protein
MLYYDTPCFIINQKEKVERLEHIMYLIKTELKFNDITIKEPFVPGDATTKDLKKFLNKKLERSNKYQNSHTYTYLNILLNEEVNNMFIFEDDIVPVYNIKDIKKMLQKIVNDCPSDADMIYLEFSHEFCNDFSENRFTKLNAPLCTAAIYYPSLESRLKIIKNFINYDKYNQIKDHTTDYILSVLINNKKINAYTYKPLFIQLEIFGSNIEGSSKIQRKTCVNLPKGILENRIIFDDLNLNYKRENFTLDFKNKKNNVIYIIIIVFVILIIIFIFLFISKKVKLKMKK